MTYLIAQAASAGEWYDGWQLALGAVGLVLMLVVWLHRILKSDINRVDDKVNQLGDKLDNKVNQLDDKLSDKLDDLRNIILNDALERARQPKPSQAVSQTPVIAETPVTTAKTPSPSPQPQNIGFATASHTSKN